MNEATSPAGDKHPGEILYDDQVDGRQWTRQATEVPQTIAWVEMDGTWEAVIRIEITGTPGQRRISKFGKDGAFLESTVQSPPPPAHPQPHATPAPTKTPVPRPTPPKD